MARALINAWRHAALAAIATVAALPGQHKQASTLRHIQPGAAGSTPDKAHAGSFTVYSEPFDLDFGEVAMKTTVGKVPQHVASRYLGTRMLAFSGVSSDIVRRFADGSESSVPMYEVYNHHATLVLEDHNGSQKLSWRLPFWTRNTPMTYDAPYREVLPYAPTTWTLNYHVLRVGSEHNHSMASRLSQCPCTPQRDIDLHANTIDGKTFRKGCTPETPSMADPPLPECPLADFTGGKQCCENSGDFVVDTSMCAQQGCAGHGKESYYFKSTIMYEDALSATRMVNRAYDNKVLVPQQGAFTPGADYQTGAHISGGEYAVPKCPDGTAVVDCVQITAWVQPIYLMTYSTGALPASPDLPFQLILAYPHLHAHALWAHLQDAHTNETLCFMSLANGRLVLGTGDEAFNERGFIVGQKNCQYDASNAPLIYHGQMLRMSIAYNASERQDGVMAGWFLSFFAHQP